MQSRWPGRLMAVTALALGGGGAVASPPVAALGVSTSAAAAHSVAADVKPAPLVTDDKRAGRSKRGVVAPALSRAMRLANDRRQAAAARWLQAMARRVRPDLKCTGAACRAGLPAARNLAGTEQPQARDYYCGPATVSEMLAQLGVRLSQAAAARELRTTTNGTDWSNSSGYPVPRVLNENQARNRYVAVALPWQPTAKQISTYETDLITDINYNGGLPLAGNAYEVAGGPHLVGNPVNQTIMHWIDIRGYQDSGAVTDYEDSVHGAMSIAWAGNVPAYSAIGSPIMADILGARGYDW
jgi:hypothetical protein